MKKKYVYLKKDDGESCLGEFLHCGTESYFGNVTPDVHYSFMIYYIDLFSVVRSIRYEYEPDQAILIKTIIIKDAK